MSVAALQTWYSLSSYLCFIMKLLVKKACEKDTTHFFNVLHAHNRPWRKKVSLCFYLFRQMR